jgi:hypothetical protein
LSNARFIKAQCSVEKTWSNERVEAVNRIVEAVFAEPDEEERKRIANPLEGLPKGGMDKQWEPFWEPQAV